MRYFKIDYWSLHEFFVINCFQVGKIVICFQFISCWDNLYFNLEGAWFLVKLSAILFCPGFGNMQVGERIGNILKHLFPVPKPDTKRIITFSKAADRIKFRFLPLCFYFQIMIDLQSLKFWWCLLFVSSFLATISRVSLTGGVGLDISGC